MTSPAASYHGYRFPPDIISHAVWLYHRFCLSFRDTEDLLAQRGITVSYEAIRQWCRRFGPAYARILRRRQGRLGDTWHLDELFVNIHGCQQYLWRAVDQDGDVIDILLQPRRDRRAAERFLATTRLPFGVAFELATSYPCWPCAAPSMGVAWAGGGGSWSARLPGSVSFAACACGMTSGPTSTRHSSRSGAR